MRPVLVRQPLCFMTASFMADNITDPSTAKATTLSSCAIQETTGSDLSIGMTRQKATSAIGLTRRSLLAPRQALPTVQTPLLLLLLMEAMVAARRRLAGIIMGNNG